MQAPPACFNSCGPNECPRPLELSRPLLLPHTSPPQWFIHLSEVFLSHDERRALVAGGVIDDTAAEGEVSPRRKKLRRSVSD